MKPTKQILFLLQYPPGLAPSQRFRVELFFPELEKNNLKYDCHYFMDENTWNILYQSGNTGKKIFGVLKGYIKRFFFLLSGLSKFEYVFVQREASPLGPPVFEWFVSRILKKKLIYDFDDAIWIAENKGKPKFFTFLKASWKVAWICRWATVVVAGNDYLSDYARQFNSNVIKIPTCVDTVREHNKLKSQNDGKITVGWTGSHSTLKYLDIIVPVVQKLQERYDITFLVIADKKPSLKIKNFEFINWKESSEIDDLLKMDIGIMPLSDDKWSEGKCGFKLIQYMSLGIPAVASPVGVNKTIIDNGKNGFFCNTYDEWVHAIERLLNDRNLRVSFGENGHNKIVQEYSIISQVNKFLNLFEAN